MKAKSEHAREAQTDRKWNGRMLLCSGIGFLVLLFASFFKIYDLSHLEGELKLKEVFYRFLLADHLQLTLFQNAELMGSAIPSHRPPESKEVAQLRAEVTPQISKEIFRAHINDCRQVLGRNLDTFLAEKPLPESGDLLSAYSPNVGSIDIAAYETMNRAIFSDEKHIAATRLWFFVPYLLGSFLVLCGALRRRSGHISRGAFFGWLGGSALLAAWFVQGFLYDRWGDTQAHITNLLDRSSSLHAVNKVYSQMVKIVLMANVDPDRAHEAQISGEFFIKHQDHYVSEAMYAALPAGDKKELASRYQGLPDVESAEGSKQETEEASEVNQEGLNLFTHEHWLFHEVCSVKLDAELKRLLHYQTLSRYALVLLTFAGAFILFLGRCVEFRESRET